MDNNIHWINYCLVDSIGCFSYTYPMYSNLSREECYPLFETLDSRLNSSGNCFVFLSDEAHSSHSDARLMLEMLASYIHFCSYLHQLKLINNLLHPLSCINTTVSSATGGKPFSA